MVYYAHSSRWLSELIESWTRCQFSKALGMLNGATTIQVVLAIVVIAVLVITNSRVVVLVAALAMSWWW